MVLKDFSEELVFKASRSSGPGGQNVNKTNTKVTLIFNVGKSLLLSGYEKEILSDFFSGRLNNKGELMITSQKYRSQLQNKLWVTGRFYKLLAEALTPRKKRVKTKKSKEANEKRLKFKKITSEKKIRRKKKIEE